VLRGLVRPADHLDDTRYDAPLGGFEMPAAARLDVPVYLDVSREQFRTRGAFRAAEVDPRGSFDARTVIFCRGFAPDSDPWFGGIKFNAAKGEMLTLRIPGCAEDRVVHRGVWLAPLGHETFRAGSTYAREPLDSHPTPDGRAEIEAKLRAFFKLPYEVIDHRAAVRPVIDAGFPVLGRHPDHPHRVYFNGLGSKGSLLAPFFAQQLATHLCGAGEIEDAVNVLKYLWHG
jgi:glycine/D-amino acid oxidase-like deaminating enzyme